MPIPTPNSGESESNFMKRCISFLRNEGKPQDQAVAICTTQWENKEMDNKLDKRMIATEFKANKDDNTYTVIGSIEKTDRDRDVVKVDGINLNNYKNNGVVLWAHQNKELPIGKTERVWKKDGKLMFKIKFAGEEHNPIAPFVEQQFKDGFLNAFSISFLPDYESMTYDERKGIRYINKSELLEISAVPVPANADALIVREYRDRVEKAWEDGIFDGKDLNEIDEEIEKMEPAEPEQEDKETKDLEAEIAALKLQLAEKELEEEIEDDIYTKLYNEYIGPSRQREADQIDEQTDDTLSIDDLI